MLLSILAILVVIAIVGGGFGFRRFGFGALSPALVVLILFFVVVFTGRL